MVVSQSHDYFTTEKLATRIKVGRVVRLSLGEEININPAQSRPGICRHILKFFVANDIKAEKQVATLLRFMGATSYGIVRNVVQPQRPKEIDDIHKGHFEPKLIAHCRKALF